MSEPYFVGGEIEVRRQTPCACGVCADEGWCSASEWQSTGPCRTEGCTHYGTEVDGGLCEACYLVTK